MKRRLSVLLLLFLFSILPWLTVNAWAACTGAEMSGGDYCSYYGRFGTVGGSLEDPVYDLIASSMYPYPQRSTEGDPDENFFMTADNLIVVQGESRPITISLTPISGFTTPLTLTYEFVGTVPAGAIVTLTSDPVPPSGNVSMQFAAAADTPLGNYTIRITATGAGYIKTKDIQISIYAPMVLTSTAPGSGIKGDLFSSSLSTSGGLPPYTFSKTDGQLPDGVTLNADGTLTGTPTGRGTFSFTVQSQDSAGHSVSKIYSIRVYDRDFRQIVIDSPWIAKQGVFSGWMTLKVLDDYDQLPPEGVPTDTEILISSSSLTGKFFANGVTSPANFTSLTIAKGTSSRLFQYEDTETGTSTITAEYASPNWQSFTHDFTVTDLPVATISGAPTSPTNATSANLTVGGTDVVAYKYSVDGGAYSAMQILVATTPIITLSSLGEGSHAISVVGKDAAGYWQAAGSASTATWTVDLTSPVAAFSSAPTSPTKATSAVLTIGGTDVVAYQYKLDDPTGNFPTTEYPVGTPISLSSLGEGLHTVYVIGRDTAGNWQAAESATTVRWTVDLSPPTGTITINNVVMGTTSTSVTLNFSASDVGSGVTQIAFSNDGATYTSWEAYNPASPTKPWTLPGGVGQRTVYVKFKDAAGNESAPIPCMITLETVPPVPVITFPSNGTAVISVLEIQGTVSDPPPSSGLSKIEINVSQNTQNGIYYLQSNKTEWAKTDPVYHLASLSGGDWRFSVGNVWDSQQSYTVTARATDNAGNTGSVSSTFTYIVQTSAYTTLTMDLSSQTILNKGQLVVTGKLSRLPEVNMDLRNLSISLDITSPTGAQIQVNPAATGVDGSYTFTFPDNNTVFTEKGPYALQARFAQAGSLAASNSDTKSVLVGASAGYAVLVQGKLPGPNPEGLASHNKTTNRIYKTLRDRGFDHANIMYFNYTKPQADVVVDEIPSKEGVESAIKIWASGKMNSVPAPLYIIMVNHGDPNAFHIGDKTISPADLSSWLDALEANLDQEARQEKIITIIGACYSGSFIPVLSKPNTNRVIIASAAADEESFKGPLEGSVDTVRSGEYFIDALFVQLGRGYSLKNSFEEATKRTEEYTRKGGAAANTPNPYFDTAMQHPLIDDNGDTRGSNVLSQGQGDGQAAKDVYLGTGATYTTNAGTVDIIGVTETKYLSQDVSDFTATLRLYVNNTTKVSSAWAIIRPPGLDLSQNQTVSSYQRDINLTPQLMTPTAGHYELQYSGFTEPGMYEIFYYIIETGTPAVVSPLKRSVVYKNKGENTPPTAPTLVKPGVNEDAKTAIIFQWNASVDSDPVTYNLVIAMDENFNNIAYRKDGLTTTLTSVDASAGLKDLTSYYWRVEAVDGYTRTVSAGRKFNTNNTNGLPGILAGIVFSDRDYSRIAAAAIKVTVNNDLTPIPVDKAADGSFILSSLSGTAKIEISADGYQPLTVSNVAVVAGDTTPLNLSMAPVIKKGDIDGDGNVTIADAILALRVISRMPLYTLETIYRDAALTSGKIGIADVIYIMQKIGELRQN